MKKVEKITLGALIALVLVGVAGFLVAWVGSDPSRIRVDSRLSCLRGADIATFGSPSSAARLASGWNPNEIFQEIQGVYVAQQIERLLARYDRQFAPGDRAKLARILVEEGQRVGVDPLFLLAVIRVESSFSKDAISNRGARGLMQVMPKTAEEVARKIGLDWIGPQQLHDPATNVQLGAQYLGRLLTRYAGSYRYALTAYNRGPTSLWRLVQEHGQLKPEYTEYFRKIQLTYQTFLRKLSDSWTWRNLG